MDEVFTSTGSNGNTILQKYYHWDIATSQHQISTSKDNQSKFYIYLKHNIYCILQLDGCKIM
jgi:hypothetical protein